MFEFYSNQPVHPHSTKELEFSSVKNTLLLPSFLYEFGGFCLTVGLARESNHMQDGGGGERRNLDAHGSLMGIHVALN